MSALVTGAAGALGGAIADRVRALGLQTSSDSLRAGHFLGVRFPGGVPEDLLSVLARNRVHVSVRGDSMRVTPHLYNDDDDVERLVYELTPAFIGCFYCSSHKR